jgi:hypothetical protein
MLSGLFFLMKKKKCNKNDVIKIPTQIPLYCIGINREQTVKERQKDSNNVTAKSVLERLDISTVFRHLYQRSQVL